MDNINGVDDLIKRDKDVSTMLNRYCQHRDIDNANDVDKRIEGDNDVYTMLKRYCRDINDV